jgi:hypothetical protein
MNYFAHSENIFKETGKVELLEQRVCAFAILEDGTDLLFTELPQLTFGVTMHESVTLLCLVQEGATQLFDLCKSDKQKWHFTEVLSCVSLTTYFLEPFSSSRCSLFLVYLFTFCIWV